MENTFNYVNIREILSRVNRHPLMNNVTLEAVIQYAVEFIDIVGLQQMYQIKEAKVHIDKYKGLLPCDLISINQVKNLQNDICMKSMTDTFYPKKGNPCGIEVDRNTFKTQNRIIFTSFEEGEILINYNSIEVDEEGFPLLIEESNYLKALELYIKQEVFGYLFDEMKIPQQVLINAQQEYCWAVGRLIGTYNTPSVSEMESIKDMWNTLIPRTTNFDRGFIALGEREYLKNH